MGIAPVTDKILPANDNDNDDDDDYYDYDNEDMAELDDEAWEPKFEPANRVSIEELGKVKVEEGLKEEAVCCSVCFDDYETECEAARLPCSHLFMEIVLLSGSKIANYVPYIDFR
ncbi:hypothetical protein FEM48_Zijuj05G0149000 [Ziziphus jujuba var. spinosa]|uniref:Uncharacterized protein n=1 Tax=Ziziphus jujuba var. spinosa TaxID=714518 RepID=A0A978VFG5_ZIZJJ|nr:hypothetical protein FEM48_Zijuj05G0149000 [Ziziphus jujuba var. spinosa]